MATLAPSNSPVEEKALSINQVTDLFAEGEEIPIKEEEKEVKSEDDLLKEEKEEEPEKEENKEEEEEEKLEPDETDLELVTPVRRQEILKKFPTIFKEFPYLEKAYYREQKYTELLPTIEDAQEAIEARDTFKKFESDILSGNTENVLKSVKQTDEKAFAKIVDNYLPALFKTDKEAYFHILGNINKSVITSMYKEGETTNNDELKQAAVLLNQFVFGNSNFVPAQKFSKETNEADPEKEKFNKERQQFESERLNSAVSQLQTKVDNRIQSTIAANIDPKGVMTDYVKRTAIRECLDSLNESIQQDSRLQVLKDKLWEKAKNDGYSPRSLDAIQSAFLSRAKSILPSLIQKTRNEALKGLGKKESSEEKKGPLPVGKSASPNKSSSKGDESSKEERSSNASKGKRTLDFFMED